MHRTHIVAMLYDLTEVDYSIEILKLLKEGPRTGHYLMWEAPNIGKGHEHFRGLDPLIAWGLVDRDTTPRFEDRIYSITKRGSDFLEEWEKLYKKLDEILPHEKELKKEVEKNWESMGRKTAKYE